MTWLRCCAALPLDVRLNGSQLIHRGKSDREREKERREDTMSGISFIPTEWGEQGNFRTPGRTSGDNGGSGAGAAAAAGLALENSPIMTCTNTLDDFAMVGTHV